MTSPPWDKEDNAGWLGWFRWLVAKPLGGIESQKTFKGKTPTRSSALNAAIEDPSPKIVMIYIFKDTHGSSPRPAHQSGGHRAHNSESKTIQRSQRTIITRAVRRSAEVV